jgi:thermitase
VAGESARPLEDVAVVRAEGDRGDALAALRADPDVAWAEPNRPRRLSAEPLADQLWGLHNRGQAVWGTSGHADADIDAPQAWALSRGDGATVAVVDTGVDVGHADLAARIVPGFDFVDHDGDPQDGHGHGTHVAGTVAAGLDGGGVVGVAPNAGVMPLRVLDASGNGNSADVAAAFAFAGDRGVRVVNASLGSPFPSHAERRAIESHPGTLYVVAAGNGGPDGVGDDVDGATREWPCAETAPNLICVGATGATDARSRFSNFGAASVDLFAPGENIVSDWVRGRPTLLAQHGGAGEGFEIMQGTSMAAPHVAGVAALAAALQPGWNGAQLKAALMGGADALPGLAGASVSGARLNAAGTARIAAGRSPAPDGPEPEWLLPDMGAPGDAPADAAPGPATRAARPRISGLRIHGRPRACPRGTGCQARTARLSFRLAADADVRVRLERRACVGTKCRWRRSGVRTRRTSAGRTRWLVSRSLLGMALRPGAWRVTVATSAGRAHCRFRVL